MDRPYVLTIAGFDPSGGAGILADIKTFEMFKTQGLSVCTAITVQNDQEVRSCEWVAFDTIAAQIDILFERFDIGVVKIGVVSSWALLLRVVERLKHWNQGVEIVLDPVLRATSAFEFNRNNDLAAFYQVLDLVTLITPNYEEIQALIPEQGVSDTIENMTRRTAVYLKGGHRDDKKGTDYLYYQGSEMTEVFEPQRLDVHEKHGTGCVLSSAIAAGRAKGWSLKDAAAAAKAYVETLMASNKGKLGYHLI